VIGAVMASTVITAALVVAGGGPVSAETACGTLQTDHCYALAQMGTYAGNLPRYISAVGADLEVDCLAVGDDNTEDANWEMWLSTNDTNPYSPYDSGYWLEEGYAAGPAAATGFQWFWADNRPGGGFNAHFIEWANALQYQNVSFYWQGGSNWNVYLAGNLVGESVNNGAFAGGTQIGAEMMVDTNGQVHAHAHNWQYTDGGVWQWVDPTSVRPYSANANQNPPGFQISWAYGPTNVTVHTPSHLCGTVPQRVPSVRPATGSGLTLASVRSIAARAAGSYATATPTAMTAVQTTRGAATALYGSKVSGTAAAEPVYLVQELGSFSAQRRSTNGAQHIISARAMHVVISARTGQVLDWGIQAPGNLRSLGSVMSLSS
jgi:hypothetical protein